jgi:hypothetical protein
MCKASLLQNIGVFSTLHIEKPTVLLSFSNAKEQRKKRKIMQRLLKESKNYGFQRHYRHGAKQKEDQTRDLCTVAEHTSNSAITT